MTRLFWLCSLLLLPTVPTQAQTSEAAEHYRAGYQLLQAQNFRNATLEFERAVAADSTYGDAFYALGKSYKALGDFDKAIKALEAAGRQTLSQPSAKERLPAELSEAYQKSAAKLFEQRKYQEAVAGFEKSLAINPNNAKAHYALGVCYNRMRNTEAARRAYTKAIEVDPSYAKAHKALGDLHRQGRSYGPAIEAYQKAIALDATLAEAWGGLARSQIDSQDLEGALQTLAQAIEANPKYEEGYLLTGAALNQLGRQQDAIAPLRQAVDLEGKDSEAHFRLAEAYYALGDYSNALDAAQGALQRQQGYHPAEVVLADTYLKLGQKDQARLYYQKAKVDDRFKDYCTHQLEELAKPQQP